MKIFAAQDRGAVINVSSMTGISSSPWNGQYGAGKAFILKMTEAVACETEKTNVDVEVITLGTTLTPSLLSNLPGGPQGEAVMKTCLLYTSCKYVISDSCIGKPAGIIPHRIAVRHPVKKI